ncbi:hypothetical protein L9F63_016951, partial [Diploptera punctata]
CVIICCNGNNSPYRFSLTESSFVSNTTLGVRPTEGVGEESVGSRLRCPAPISRLRVEKIEGGLMVAGVVCSCQLSGGTACIRLPLHAGWGCSNCSLVPRSRTRRGS